ncbi:MAG: type I-E CRISPR-associated endonuclease Cas1e [Candidatus Nanoarchaeia archaeon]|jgi:CRISPR-associated protein Cas1|nr:type I-E CRISPR-associated endonuclease Cas1e [Candidatus Nanoarchaeia archaeon]
MFKHKKRLFVKITHENLPQIKDRYPFLYLERGRLEIDDSSVKWIDCDCNIIRIPCATICSLILGPGTSVTHEAVKVLAASNCNILWTGEDSLIFYAVGQSPTSNTRNLRKQMLLASDSVKSEKVARNMFSKRFPDIDLKGKNLKEMMGMEGFRVKELYKEKAKKYEITWYNRFYKPGEFILGDTTNKYLTTANAALYGLLCSVIYTLGYSLHIGFIHSGSPLPFVYDIADLYKDEICIDLAFALTVESAGNYDRDLISSEFRQKIIDADLLGHISEDIKSILKV